MITLALLHPNKSEPLRCWTFGDKTLIRIGRAADNDIVLYSAVVSRYHLQVLKNGEVWELENLGANGTFLHGKAIKKTVISDGMIFSLAGSGPKIQIYLREYETPPESSFDTIFPDEGGEENLKETMT